MNKLKGTWRWFNHSVYHLVVNNSTPVPSITTFSSLVDLLRLSNIRLDQAGQSLSIERQYPPQTTADPKPITNHYPIGKQPQPFPSHPSNRHWSNTSVRAIVDSNHQLSKGNNIQANHHPKHQTTVSINPHTIQNKPSPKPNKPPNSLYKTIYPTKSLHSFHQIHSILPSILPNPARANANTQYPCSLFSKYYSFKQQRAFNFRKTINKKTQKQISTIIQIQHLTEKTPPLISLHDQILTPSSNFYYYSYSRVK